MLRKYIGVLSIVLTSLFMVSEAEAVTCQKGYIAYNNSCYKQLKCKNKGYQQGTQCICPEGWTGNLCQTAKKCPYKDTKCGKGFYATGNKCKTGNKTVVECKANACNGYNYTKCPTGYASSATCQSGKTKKYQCDKCAKGYIKYNGKCIKQLKCKNKGYQQGTQCICPEGWTGNLCQTAKKCPYKDTKCGKGFYATGNKCKTGKKTVVECKANACSGYNYTKCPTGYASSATCQSGKTKKYQCDKCAKGYVKYNGKCIKQLKCKNKGYQQGTQCICLEGWTGNLCQTAKKCPYKDTKCGKGFYATGNKCKTGKKTVVECKANACSGYNYTKCPTGTKQTGTCQSGKTKKLKCECPNGQILSGSKCIAKLNCQNDGTQNGSSCVCKDGWTGNLCQTAKSCAGYYVECPKDYYRTSDTCLSGNTTMYKCATDLTDIDQGSPIVKKTLTDNDKVLTWVDEDGEEEYTIANNQDVKVITNSENAVTGVLSHHDEVANIVALDGIEDIKVAIEQRGNGDVYGMRAEYVNSEENDGLDVDNVLSAKNSNAKATIEIKNSGNGNVYGMYTDAQAVNANDAYLSNVWADGSSKGTGVIDITNSGSGNVYGIEINALSPTSDFDASNAQADESAEAVGVININDSGSGNVYGLHSQKYVSNASVMRDDNIAGESKAHGLININKTGSGNVYGIKTGDWAQNAGNSGGAEVEGIIRINYSGMGKVYGIAGKEISNAMSQDDIDGMQEAYGYINVINNGSGNAYGMYSDVKDNFIHHFSNNEVSSITEMVNRGQGLAVGLYSKDGRIINSGDVIIHNLGNGTAVGIYADGTATVENSGNITIDKEAFVDELDNNRKYTANTTGGKAIGIYGTSGSSITNTATGVIKIDGASKAYGIFSEGSDVINHGTIEIDGEYTENAIRLNGGKLLQNGVMKVGANWDNNGISGSTDCIHGVKQDDTCVCLTGWVGDKCDEAASCPHDYSISCGRGYSAVSNDTCKSGNQLLVKCVENDCTGFEYTSCPLGYTSSGICYSGSVMKLECGNCAEGYIKDGSKCIVSIGCQNGGTQNGDKCNCPEGWTGEYCQTAEICSDEYKVSCSEGYHAVSNDTCKSGNQLLVKCVENDCTGYYLSCEEGYKPTGKECKSGKTTYVECIESQCEGYPLTSQPTNCKKFSRCPTNSSRYRCDKCNIGYGRDGNGKCVEPVETALIIQSNDQNNSTQTVANSEYRDVFGLTNETGKDHYNAYNYNGAMLDITNDSDGNVYGVHADNAYAHNAYASSTRTSKGEIQINNTGNGGVLGLYGVSGVANAQTKSGNVRGYIKIENQGDGSIYGIKTEFTEFNEGQTVSDVLVKNAESIGGTAIALIDIKNTGSGDIYGMDAGSTGVNVLSNGNGESSGKILLKNTGSGNVYGIYAEYLAQNTTSIKAENEAEISIENVGDGRVYGLYSNGYAHNAASYTNAETSGLISIKNRGNGDIAAITSADKYTSDAFNTNNDTYYYFKDIASYHLYNARSNAGTSVADINIQNEGNGDITVFDTIINNSQTFNTYSGNVTYNTYAINNGTAQSNIVIKNESSEDATKTIALSKDTINLSYAQNKGTTINNLEIDNDGQSDIVFSKLTSSSKARISSKDNSIVENNVKIVNKGNGDINLPISATAEQQSTVKNTLNIDSEGNGNITASFEATTSANKEISSNITIKHKGNGTTNIINNTGTDSLKTDNKVDIEDIGNGIVSIQSIAGAANNENKSINYEIAVKKQGDGTVNLNLGNGLARASDGGNSSGKLNFDLSGENIINYNSASSLILASATGANGVARANSEINITRTNHAETFRLPILQLQADGLGEVTNKIKAKSINSGNINLQLQATAYGKLTNAVEIENIGNNNVNVGFSLNGGEITNIANNVFEIINEGNGNITADVDSGQTTLNNTGNGAIIAGGDKGAVNITNRSISVTAGNIQITGDNKTVTLDNTGNNNITVSGDSIMANGVSVSVTNRGNGAVNLSGYNKATTLNNTGNGAVTAGGDSGSVNITNSSDAGTAGNIQITGDNKTVTLDNTGNNNITVSGNNETVDELLVSVTNRGNGAVNLSGNNKTATLNNTGNGNITVSGDSGSVDITNSSDVETAGNIQITGDNKTVTLDNTGNNNITVSGNNESVDELLVNVTNRGNGTVNLSGNNKTATLNNTGNGNITVSGDSGSVDILSSGSGLLEISGTNSYFIKNNGKGITDTSSDTITKIIHSGLGDIISSNSDSIIDNRGTGLVNITSSGLVINRNSGSIKGGNKSKLINLVDGNVYNASEIANVGNGLAVGLYAQSDVSNSKSITIHNLGNGIAVGIYADSNANLTNSGRITIDREDYVGKNLKDDGTVEEVTYTANGTGGKAIGIYGAQNSSITNTGTIRINGAETAYGIFSEGGNVTNSGTILIDGAYTENAIRINGGQLFQNGVLKVDADWNDNGIRGKYTDIIGGTKTYNYNYSNNFTLDNNIYRNIIGLKSPYSSYSMYNVFVNTGGSDTSSSLITINNTNDGNVYGMDGYKSYNAYTSFDSSYTKNASATININNQGDGDVYGITGSDSAYNAYKSYSSHRNNTTSGTITITNTGNGNVYGISANKAYNSYIYGSDISTSATSKSSGTINITNTGNGNIYGMYGNNLYNAYKNSASEYRVSRGTINITNNGTGNAYGMHGRQVYNEFKKDYSYYLVGEVPDSEIEMTNNSDGLAVGIYANNGTIENAGNITINNRGNGTAIGIYADGSTTATNTGNITIYKSNGNNDKAIGIYGAKNSTITNSGKITVNAATAYGIFSEGGNVTNSGTITINGATNSANRIQLNKGKLLQDGVLVANADFANAGCAEGYIEQSGICYLQLNCQHGTQNKNSCICSTGYEGTLCDRLKSGYIEQDGQAYVELTCNHGYQNQTQCICDSRYHDGGKGVYCTVPECENGFEQDNICHCPTGYNGEFCEIFDDENYIIQNGQVYAKINCNQGTQNGDSCSCNEGYYGNRCEYAYIGNMEIDDGKTAYVVSNRTDEYNISYENYDDKDIVGLYLNSDSRQGNGTAASAETADQVAVVSLYNSSLDGVSNNSVYGVVSDTGYGANAYYGDGHIFIGNHGNGDTYGLYDSYGKGVVNGHGAQGIISIYHPGNGDVYGVYTKGTAYNAGIIYGQSEAVSKGIIHINNSGNGNVYGMYNSNGYNINNAGYYGNGTISIINSGSGNAYGMHGGNKNYGYTNVANESYVYGGKQTTSTIELVNRGNGLAVGLYAYGTGNGTSESEGAGISNSGDIKIHNLAGGTAIGILAEGNTHVSNQGNITIDRESFTDDAEIVGTGTTYSASSGNNLSKAIGIYGTAASNIFNEKSGVIRISGANKAYGIYSEGGNVTNNGQIIIDGNDSHENAIRMNGGKLMQDGKLIANADFDSCAEGYILQNGVCYVKLNCNNGRQEKNSCICDEGWNGADCLIPSLVGSKEYDNSNHIGMIELVNDVDRDVYGIKSNEEIKNATSSATLIKKDIIDITNNSKGNVYGMKGNAYNAYGLYNPPYAYREDVEGEIRIRNTGDGDVYGLKGGAWNAYNEGIASVVANISIENTGNGSVYGLFGNFAHNADSHYSGDGGNSTSLATAGIRIINNGSGNVYGVAGTTMARNANSWSGNNKAVANVNIKNIGDGNVYGVYSNQGAAYNAYSQSTTSYAKGVINIINQGTGVSYGLYGKNLAKNYGSDTVESTIEITNTGEGLAVGIYSEIGDIENSGEIKIHNLGNGTAIGIYSDGWYPTINSGTITIDRETYTDADGMQYYGVSNKGGRAIGIYGASKATITNTETGVIRINGAETAYGIWSEGGDVTNQGIIEIDGKYTKNAIRLNAGQLFQDGVMKVDADWDDNGDTASAVFGSTDSANNDTITINNYNDYTIYGMEGTSTTYNALSKDKTNNSSALIDIDNHGNKGDVYGIHLGYYGVSSDSYNAFNFNDGSTTGSIKISNYAGSSSYGIWNDSGIATNAYNASYPGSANGSVEISNYVGGDVYGIFGVNKVYNGYSHYNNQGKAIGQITISNEGNGNVYGIKSGNIAHNAVSRSGLLAQGDILIDNHGNGNVYGIIGDYTAYNALNDGASSSGTVSYVAKGLVSISNEGNGDVYGIKANNNVYNAYNVNGTSAEGFLYINNQGDGNVYGIVGSNIQNAANENNHEVTGTITILNGRGYAYGLYSDKTDNVISNISDDIKTSIIEIVNTDSGKAIGIYSRNGMVTNTGDIKIHNLGDGVTVGIYADGSANVTNSGTITIDRETYVDELNNNQEYTATSDKGGKAIGIYGAAGSSITNTESGIIRINGANKAYGIWSEGGNVINNGQIIIDGSNSHENAIHMNGGKLFQDGVIKVDADWSANGESALVCGENAHLVNNQCVCDQGYTDINGICQYSASNMVNNDTISIINNDNSDVYGMKSEAVNEEIINAQNENASIMIENHGTGNVYGMYGNMAKNLHNEGSIKGQGNIEITTENATNVYGIYGINRAENTDASGWIATSYYPENEQRYVGDILIDKDTVFNISSTIRINSTDSQKVYGLYSDNNVYNANGGGTYGQYRVELIGNGLIEITNTGSADVYGIYSNDYAANANYNATAEIKITNNGDGDVYGMYAGGQGSSYNSQSQHNTSGLINIDNTGDGNVYGMYADYHAANASGGTGLIRIDNNGSGKAYGIKAQTAHNGMQSEGTFGKISMINRGSGVAYGMSGAGYLNNNAREEINQYAVIEMANIGDGLVVGMYSKENRIENDGEIKIHNLGDGTAIGIYADGDAEVSNNGIITIDREQYTDDKGTTDTSDDVTYSKMQTIGGKAIGIYGTAGSEIGNDGIIRINGAATAYGIYAEAGAYVENDGIIEIDGQYTENAIRINGGQLMQNGILKVNADWINNGSIVSDGYDDIEPQVINNDVITKNGKSDDMIVGFDVLNAFGMNALAQGQNQEATIEITQSGTGNIYGMRGLEDSDEIEPALLNAATIGSGTARGTIRIVNESIGNGDIYGMYSNSENIEVANATYAEEKATEDTRTYGLVEINNKGNNSKNVYGIFSNEVAMNAEGDKIGTSHGDIAIDNIGNGNVYGMKAKQGAYNADATEISSATGEIRINNIGNGDVYGMVSEEKQRIYNSAAGHSRGLGETKDSSHTYGRIYIENQGNGDIYGAKIGIDAGNNNQSIYNSTAFYNSQSTGIIRIGNNGTGTAYGMYGNMLYNTYIGGKFADYNPHAEGAIRVINKGSGKAYGMYGWYMFNQSDDNQSSTIEIANINNGYGVGIYADNGHVINSGDINIHNLENGTAIGIYADGSTNVQNSGNIIIDRQPYEDDVIDDVIIYQTYTERGGNAIGIYAAGGSSIYNQEAGKITINGADNAVGIYAENGIDSEHQTSVSNLGIINITNSANAYGIWAEGENVNVYNNGTISINGTSCTGTDCNSANNAIVLNGGTLFQDGTFTVSSAITSPAVTTNSAVSTNSTLVAITPAVQTEEVPADQNEPVASYVPTRKAASLNLNDFGGTVVASATSQFIVEGAISGDLAMNNNVVENGFDTTYKVKDMVQAEDVSGLNLISQSALFDAKLVNDTDAVMTMKSFDAVVDNKSLAGFLAKNYKAENNEVFFAMLKGKESVSGLNSALNDISGQKMFNRMAFEDFNMMRELNFDMNNNIFNTTENHFYIGGDVAPLHIDGNGTTSSRYALLNNVEGRRSVGFGVAFTDLNSSDRKGDNSRDETMFQASMPMGYKMNGFNFITAPRFGYAYGTYDRKGYKGENVDGTVEKHLFGVMNEVRYPLELAGWKVAPTAELNMLSYHIKGHEEHSDYALNIKSQTMYSVESGLGVTAGKDIKLGKEAQLSFNSGIGLYHEFGDPYRLKLGVEGMDGSFRLQNDHGRNRAVIRSGFDYNWQDLNIYGKITSYIDREYNTAADVGLKWNF